MTLTAHWQRISIITLALGVSLALSSCAATQETAPSKPSLPSLTAEQSKASEEQALDTAWSNVTFQFPDTVRPSVEPVRRVTPDEQSDAVAKCLQDAGYADAKSDGDGGVLYGTIPEGQQSAQAITLYTCYAKYPIDAKYLQPATPSQIEYIYHYWQNDLTECLNSEGIDVPDAPSWSSFQETFGSRQMWDPYENLVALKDQGEISRISEKCVRYPSEYNGY